MNTLTDTFIQVKQVLQEILQLDESFLDSDNEFQLIGNLPEFDSMAVVSVITGLEEHFNITIEDDDIDAEIFETIESLVKFVDSKLV
ncbi:MAG: acyl carrier protein [Gammaproteobacteria bacterium]|nr:acyl carrier protein [Gammaproteobacteria bacterium]